ncbi:prophage regulatory protein [Paraburkholderia sp. Clong3]|uniref:helix-turn-helix transcriptional regulator n=1 Tax=Paraburkholderia sp. Clong3 TaxID=2991061 RepID=UPI003D1C3EE2
MAAKNITSPSELARLPETGFIRMKRLVPAFVPVGRSTLYEWIKQGRFPAPVKLGPKATGFRVEDIRAWLASREVA